MEHKLQNSFTKCNVVRNKLRYIFYQIQYYTYLLDFLQFNDTHLILNTVLQVKYCYYVLKQLIRMNVPDNVSSPNLGQ